MPALTSTIFPDHAGQSNQGQPDRRGPVSRRSSLEDLPKARYTPSCHSSREQWGTSSLSLAFPALGCVVCLDHPHGLVRQAHRVGALRVLPRGLKRLESSSQEAEGHLALSSVVSILSLISLSISIGVIKLKNNGDFFIANEGRRPIYIDGRPVLCGSKWRLSNNSVVEVSWGWRTPGCVAWCVIN